LSTLINADPVILSLMILFSASIFSRLLLKRTLTFLSTIKNAPPMTGTIEITVSASFQFIRISRIEVPAITKTEEIIVTMPEKQTS
jgi:hypothetical protein